MSAAHPEVAEGGHAGRRREGTASRDRHAARRGEYTSYKVANILVEFSTSIPRTQLRPGYGDGFLGAPLQTGQLPERLRSQQRGGRRGTSSTHSNTGNSHHVCTESCQPRVGGAGL